MTTRSNSYPGEPVSLPPGELTPGRSNLYDRFLGDTIAILLSKENIPVVVNPGTGVSDFSGAASRVRVYLKYTDDTESWTISKQDFGVTSTLSGNVVTITNITGNIGFVDVTLVKDSTTITRRITVYNVYRSGESTVGIDAPAFYSHKPALPIPTDKDGANGVYTYATTPVVVLEGGEDVTDEWVLAVASFTAGITHTLVNGVLTVIASTVDAGVISLTADKAGYTTMNLTLPVIKVKQGLTGTAGANGTNGTNGTNGVTPVFQISGSNLQVSYDSGGTWSTLGAVVGTNGTNGTNGVSPIFRITSGALEVSYNTGGTWASLGSVTGADGTNGANAYLYVAYASDAVGTDFTTDSAVGVTLPYLAILNTNYIVEVPAVGDFTGLWRYVGPKFGDFTKYRITLPSASSVTARCAAAVEGTDYPTGWVLAAGAVSTDLDITHSLGLRIASVSIFTVAGGIETLLIGNAGYSGLKSLSDDIAQINALATIETQIAIYITFA